MKPSIPQGTRDFGPATVRKRQYILSTIQSTFELFGFEPLETPAMENIDTLMGKYGEEGDKLIFKILNNGLDHPSKIEKLHEGVQQIIDGKTSKNITERALRYDLTIPFARYVAMNAGQLTFPFKRYQIQPVWRADRPQRGRYREFYQCDCDIVGSQSLMNELELILIYNQVFKKLHINIELKINNRKILSALAQKCGGEEKLIDITTAIDKIDKIGIEKVKEELSSRGLTTEQIATIADYLNIVGSNTEKLQQIKHLLTDIPIGIEGITELETLLEQSTALQQPISLDFSLARGLNYYTGTIFEIKAKDVQMGSIGGGGRYDDLTGLFGLNNMPGVGISFGIDRIFDVMEELSLFPQVVEKHTDILFFNLGKSESWQAYTLMQMLRNQGIRCELYHEQAKFDKQFKFAQKKNIRFVGIIGTNELENNTCIIKDLQTSKQEQWNISDIDLMIAHIKAY